MGIQFRKCTTDNDFAKTSLFFLEHRLDLRPDLDTIEGVTALHGYITNGHLGQVTDASGNIVALVGYYYGIPENGFEDKHIVLVDAVIIAPENRKTTVFVRGLQQMVDAIRLEAPHIRLFQFNAAIDNHYLQKLYAKFAKPISMDSGFNRYSVEIDQLKVFLDRFSQRNRQ